MEYAILFLPLVGSILTGFFSKYLGEKISLFLSCALVLTSAILSIFIFYQVISFNYEKQSGDINIRFITTRSV